MLVATNTFGTDTMEKTCYINVTSNTPLSLSVTTTDELDSCDGTATVTASGGIPPYTYAWSTTPVQTNATATGLCTGTYTVTVTDANADSSTATATITLIVGLYETAANNNLLIYPNPFNQSTTVVFDNDDQTPFDLILYDMLGNQVSVLEYITTNQVIIEKGNLTPGMYFISLQGNGIEMRGKLMVE